MTLYVEASDSQTNALIASALDRKNDRHTRFMTWQTSVSNAQGARRILRGWAKSLRDGLDEANAETKGAACTVCVPCIFGEKGASIRPAQRCNDAEICFLYTVGVADRLVVEGGIELHRPE